MEPGLSLKGTSRRVSLNWTQLDAVITGVSAIDLQSLAIRTRQDAYEFAREYGFDMELEDQRLQIEQIHKEAVDFIRQTFLNPKQRKLIPDEIVNPENVLDLLIYSSKYLNKVDARRMWACAVLKVMHGIIHIDHDIKLRYFEEIRSQIFDSLDRLITDQGEEHFLGDDEVRIPLYFYQKKRNKGRWSILLKLLQKPTYVASDIYDHLGIRMIFNTKIECLFALKILRRTHLISVTNIKPFRSRNTMIDLRIAKSVFNRYRPLLERSETYPQEILERIDRELFPPDEDRTNHDNPHSAHDYEAIQITVRKMIRLQGDHSLPRNQSVGFYFDYEIQLMDKAAWIKTMHGPASHQAYKKRQVSTAAARVLGPRLIQLLEEESRETAQGEPSEVANV